LKVCTGLFEMWIAKGALDETAAFRNEIADLAAQTATCARKMHTQSTEENTGQPRQPGLPCAMG
jgi:hypothetical protein